MRIRSVAAKPAPSLDLVPKRKHQILVDRDLADVIKRVAGALGYKSMSGLLNDALVCYLAAEYPHLQLIFDPEDEVQQRRAAADAKQQRLDELASAGQRIDERRQKERREKQRELPKGAERRNKTDRRKG